MTNNCTAIAPGKSVKSWQQFGLNLASRLYGGRDVVIAIDLTESIDSATWVETPATSLFRRSDSAASKERHGWLEALPIRERSKTITTNDNRTYKLSVVDIAPTVQEFCTPTPGGKETCSWI